jgi:DNA processing protein
MSDDEARVLSFIGEEPKHIDVIMTQSGSMPGRLSGLLTGLELKGLVKQLAGKYFVRDSP